MKYLALLYTSFVSVTREADSDDRWDRDSTFTSRSFHGARISGNDKDFYDLVVTDEFAQMAKDQDIYVLFAEYTTGDSFGCDDNGSIEIIGAFTNRSIAEENAQRIRDHDSKYELDGRRRGVNLVLANNDGSETIKMSYIPWHGYFESLNSVTVFPCRAHLE